jgi:uncharacterized protein YdaU (DUF1376 family)
MHYYPHNIADFNNATRHLTRVERSVYRDAIERYYDTEQPLQGDDFNRLARILLCQSEEEKAALTTILDEFFVLDGGVYRHERCDSEIEKYQANNSAKARAGKASAEARRKAKKADSPLQEQQKETPVEHVLNTCSTDEQLTNNQEPITNNHKPKESRATPFTPPTVDEVADYVSEKQYPVDPVRFVSFYESKGWMVGKSKMKCWKSAVTGWSTRNDQPNKSSGGAAAPKQTAAQRIAARRFELATQSPDLGVVAEDDRDVWPPLDQSAGGGAKRYLASGTS